MTQVNLTTAQIDAGLLFNDPAFPNGSRWSSTTTITFSIPTASSIWNSYGAGSEITASTYSVLNAAQADQFRAAVAIWDSYIAPTLVEVPDNASGSGSIRVAFTNVQVRDGSGTWGYTYMAPAKGTSGSPKAGDIWIDASHASGNLTGYDFEATLHELGHAFGLEHPFNDDDSTINYLPTQYQNRLYTIMSYTDTVQTNSALYSYSNVGGRPVASHVNVLPSTPMVLDIQAVQDLYGADTATNAGDTVWGFRGQGDIYINGTQSAVWPYIRSIYDASGTDTFDLTQMTRHSVVDMHPGSYSSIGLFSVADQVAYYRALFPSFTWSASNFSSSEYTGDSNLGVSFSTTIENIKLSNYGDMVFGNDVANQITSGAGNDVIDGGGGVDTVLYSAARALYTVTKAASGAITVTDAGSTIRDGSDTLTNVEQVKFTDVTLVFDLHSAQDTLVYEIYQAAYARMPDNAGFRYWATVADAQNTSSISLADSFLAAPEYAQRYGTNVSNAAYIQALYTNVLGRAPDQAGLDYWIGQADAGQPRDQLLVNFAISNENVQLIGSHISTGYWTS